MESDEIAAVRERITEARAAIWQSVRLEGRRLALEGPIESAYQSLEDALDWLNAGKFADAKACVVEAHRELTAVDSQEAIAIIVEDRQALGDAIRILSGLV